MPELARPENGKGLHSAAEVRSQRPTALRRLLLALTLSHIAACSTPPVRIQQAQAPSAAAAPAAADTLVFVVRRKWHVDVGVEAVNLRSPLAGVRAALPAARYFLFGFGDRGYLLSKSHHFGSLIGALWPGPGVILLTGLKQSPEAEFGAENVVRISVSPAQQRNLQAFIWASLTHSAGTTTPLASGPYAGSYYYAAEQRYSALYTCNTWAADALEAASLPVHTFGVELAGQIWRQARPLGAAAVP